jgi:hypothetical protein
MIKAHFNAFCSTFLPYTPMDEAGPQDDSAILSNI